MAVRVRENRISGDYTAHRAEWTTDTAADAVGAWVVSWLPARRLTLGEAITAVGIADEITRLQTPNPLERCLTAGTAEQFRQAYWARVAAWVTELGVTVADAVEACSAPPVAVGAGAGEVRDGGGPR
jgi:hypothetical protein